MTKSIGFLEQNGNQKVIDLSLLNHFLTKKNRRNRGFCHLGVKKWVQKTTWFWGDSSERAHSLTPKSGSKKWPKVVNKPPFWPLFGRLLEWFDGDFQWIWAKKGLGMWSNPGSRVPGFHGSGRISHFITFWPLLTHFYGPLIHTTWYLMPQNAWLWTRRDIRVKKGVQEGVKKGVQKSRFFGLFSLNFAYVISGISSRVFSVLKKPKKHEKNVPFRLRCRSIFLTVFSKSPETPKTYYRAL